MVRLVRIPTGLTLVVRGVVATHDRTRCRARARDHVPAVDDPPSFA
jgi:hypothetical protein